VISKLRAAGEGVDTREAPAEEAEVQDGDRQTGSSSVSEGRPGREDACKNGAPAERDREMNWERGQQETPAIGLTRENDRPGGEGRLERIATGHPRVNGRWSAAHDRRDGPGNEPVTHPGKQG
jgi:hypothetical protein